VGPVAGVLYGYDDNRRHCSCFQPHLTAQHLTVHNNTSIGVNSLSSECGAVHAAQKHHTGCNLARLQGPANRGCKLLHRIIIHGGGNQRGPDRARRNRVHADSFTAVHIGEAAGEGDDGALSGGIVEQVRATNVGIYTGVIDDGAAGLHVRNRSFAEMEEGVDVGVEGPEPLLPTQNVSLCDDTMEQI